MNEQTPRVPSSPANPDGTRPARTTARAVAAASCLALAAGCSNPFRTLPSDYGDPVPRARLLEVDPISLTKRPPEAQERVALPAPVSDIEDRVELGLDQARAYTLENNLDLRVALINPAAAAQDVREQEAAWEAVAGIDARWTETDQPTADQLTGSQIETQTLTPRIDVPLRTGGNIRLSAPLRSSRNNNQFTLLNPAIDSDLEFSISQPLLRGGGRQANTHFLRVAAYQQGIELARTKLEVIRQLANADRAYWRLFAVHRALDVALQQHELATQQLDRSRRLFDGGRVAEIEVIRAEEGVATRLEAIIQAANDVKQQQRELKRIMNAPDLPLEERPIIWPATNPEPAPFNLEPERLTKVALDQRMELLELELQLSADASLVALRRNEALPEFTLDYTYRLNGLGDNLAGAARQLREHDFEDWSVGVTVETPVGNSAAKARVARAVIDRLQRLSTRDARRLSIEQEVRDAVDNIDAGWQRILAARQSAILAGRTLDAEERQFDVGRSTSTDVLDAAARLADAQLAEIRALTEYQIAQVDLAFATGSVLGASRVDWDPIDPRQGEPGEPAASAQQDAATEGPIEQ